jgi:TPR repeat protein
MGVMYESGYGVTEEPKTAFLYYNKAARYPCPEAYIKMGFCYRNGFGVDQNSKDAIKYFKSAADTLP